MKLLTIKIIIKLTLGSSPFGPLWQTAVDRVASHQVKAVKILAEGQAKIKTSEA